MTKHEAPAAIQPGTEIAVLPPAERAIVVLKSAEAEKQLRELVAKTSEISAPVDKAGRDEVHGAAMSHKNARLAIEKAGKAAREDATAFSQAVIAEQKRLVAINAEEEERLFGLRDTYDERVKREREEAERKERARVAAIKERIHGIKNLPVESTADTAEQLAETLADLRGYEITFEDFSEFQEEAQAVREQTIGTLSKMHELAVAREAAAAAARAEQERLAAERAEIERQARELAEQKAALERDRAALAANQEQEREEREAEQRAHERQLSGDAEPGVVEIKTPPARNQAAEYMRDNPPPSPIAHEFGADPCDPGRWRDGEPGPGTEPDAVDELFDRSEHPPRGVDVAQPETDQTVVVLSEPELRMNAYYYSFEPTGVRLIDMILSAVADAGHTFHHTDQWTDESEACAPHVGRTPVEWIQNAAAEAARYMSELETREEWLELLEAAGVDNWEGIDEAHRIRRDGGA